MSNLMIYNILSNQFGMMNNIPFKVNNPIPIDDPEIERMDLTPFYKASAPHLGHCQSSLSL